MKLRDSFRQILPERDNRCAAIIHTASAAAGTASAASIIPGSDAIAIAPIQVAMVVALAYEFDVPVSQSAVRSTLYASLGRIVGRGGSRLLLRWLPLYGNVVRAAVAVSVTEALGWAAVERLKAGGTVI